MFKETRRKDLVNFLKKILKHPALKSSPEVTVFITSDADFVEFRKKEEILNHPKEKGIFEKVTEAFNYYTNRSGHVSGEMNDSES